MSRHRVIVQMYDVNLFLFRYVICLHRRECRPRPSVLLRRRNSYVDTNVLEKYTVSISMAVRILHFHILEFLQGCHNNLIIQLEFISVQHLLRAVCDKYYV
jgi:hypothetical protein